MIGRALRLILTASAAAAITASGLLAQAPTGDADIPVSKKNFIYRLSLGDRIDRRRPAAEGPTGSRCGSRLRTARLWSCAADF
jgi:hypothetical protein